MMGFEGLKLSSDGLVPNDPRSREEVNNVLLEFVRAVDAGEDIPRELLTYVRDGVARYADGDKTPWKAERGNGIKGNPIVDAEMIFNAEILPRLKAFMEGAKYVPVPRDQLSRKQSENADNSRRLRDAKSYLKAGGKRAEEITKHIHALAKEHGLPDGDVEILEGGIVWMTSTMRDFYLDSEKELLREKKRILDEAKQALDRGDFAEAAARLDWFDRFPWSIEPQFLGAANLEEIYKLEGDD